MGWVDCLIVGRIYKKRIQKWQRLFYLTLSVSFSCGCGTPLFKIPFLSLEPPVVIIVKCILTINISLVHYHERMNDKLVSSWKCICLHIYTNFHSRFHASLFAILFLFIFPLHHCWCVIEKEEGHWIMYMCTSSYLCINFCAPYLYFLTWRRLKFFNVTIHISVASEIDNLEVWYFHANLLTTAFLWKDSAFCIFERNL